MGAGLRLEQPRAGSVWILEPETAGGCLLHQLHPHPHTHVLQDLPVASWERGSLVPSSPLQLFSAAALLLMHLSQKEGWEGRRVHLGHVCWH